MGLRQAAEEFERRIHPVVTGATGDVWNPGVDNDPRLTVLHTPLTFAAGYFGSRDEFTKATHPKSNEREMIYMNTSLEPGGAVYLSVLAHEFQHAVAWNQDNGEESWINEGMAEYATEQVGYGGSFVRDFLSRPGTQLNFWPDVGRATAPHYGAAELFVNYLADHFGGYDGVGRLFRLPQDGVDGVDAYLAGYGLRFEDVFGDWVVANYLDLDDGLYGYPSRSVRTPSAYRMSGYGERTGALAQFGTRYFELDLPDGDAVIRFQGAPTVGQTASDCHGGSRCWWSNRGDSINPKLTREFDLSGLDAATLEFWAWYDIEEGWDYAYVEASGDGGLTWRVLSGEHSTTTDPVGNAYGPGYTGESGGWVRENVDLTPFGGRAGIGAVRVRYRRRGVQRRAADRRPERPRTGLRRRRRERDLVASGGVRAYRQRVASVVHRADYRDSFRRGAAPGAAADAGRDPARRDKRGRRRLAHRAGGGGRITDGAAHTPAGGVAACGGGGAVGRGFTPILTFPLRGGRDFVNALLVDTLWPLCYNSVHYVCQ